MLSASPLELVVVLYDAALQAVRQARFADDAAGRVRQVGRASAVLTELTVSLDRTQGGEIAQGLAELYDYLQRKLAEVRQDPAPLVEVETLLATLAEGWRACAAELPDHAAA